MSRSVMPRCLALLLAVALVTPSRPYVARADDPIPEADPEADGALAPGRALALALEHNPSFRAALYDAVAARANAQASADARVANFTASTSGQYAEAITGTASGAVRTRVRQINASIGINYTTPIGTVLTASLSNNNIWREINRDPSTTQLFLVGPNFTADAALTIRQPLLRGAGTDAVLAEQRQAAAAEESADFDVDDAASQLVADVLVAYWELWYAERSLGVQENAVALATRQLEEARARQRLGTIAPADALQFATAKASLEETLVTARATRTSRVLELARLLGVDAPTVAALRVGDAPPEAGAPPAMDTIVAALRRRSPQLRALEADIEAAEQRVVAGRNAARARLDLTGGVGATTLFTDDTYAGLSLPGGRPALNANVGLELELPLTSNRARSELAAARAQLDAAEARYTAAVAALEVEVATRHAELASAIARLSLVAETANVAGELAAAERSRLTLGTTTPAVLIEAQQTERESRLRLDRTAADAVIATLRFEDGAGLLLERFSITEYGEPE